MNGSTGPGVQASRPSGTDSKRATNVRSDVLAELLPEGFISSPSSSGPLMTLPAEEEFGNFALPQYRPPFSLARTLKSPWFWTTVIWAAFLILLATADIPLGRTADCLALTCRLAAGRLAAWRRAITLRKGNRTMPPQAPGQADWREHWQAAGASAYFDAFAEPLLELAVAHFAPAAARGGRLLDVGCGRGRNAEMFRRLGMEVTGINVDEVSLQQARQAYPGIDFGPGDIENLAFPDATFDAVFSSSVLQYVDWPRGIRQCHRILKPGGRAVFIENLRGNPVAIGFRLLHRLLGWRYGTYQTPRGHVDWKELPEFQRVFAEVDFHALHLTTPLALVWPLLQSKAFRKPFELRGKGLYRACVDSTDRRCDISPLSNGAVGRW